MIYATPLNFSATPRLPQELKRVMAQVILDETGNEVVAMVVTRLPAQGQRVIGRFRCCFKRFRFELRHEKIIPVALVDQDRQFFGCTRQQGAGIPFAPVRAIFAQVTGKRLFAPRCAHRIADRREG